MSTAGGLRSEQYPSFFARYASGLPPVVFAIGQVVYQYLPLAGDPLGCKAPDRMSRIFAQYAAQVRRRHEPIERTGQRLEIFMLDEDAVVTAPDQLARTIGTIERDDRQTAGHRFAEGIGKALIARRQHKGCSVRRPSAVNAAQPPQRYSVGKG